MFDALSKSHGISEKAANDVLSAGTSSGVDKLHPNSRRFGEKLDGLLQEKEAVHRAILEDRYSLIGKSFGTTTFETFAREGNTRYQDLWLKNPRDPFAVSSVHSLTQDIPDSLDYDNHRSRLSSCMNLTKKSSKLHNNALGETEGGNFKRYDSLSNHATASSSENKLSDISTPRQSFEHLKGDGTGSRYYPKYDIERPRTVDIPYPQNSNVNVKIKHGLPESIPGNKLFQSAKRAGDMEKTMNCMEQIRKCLEDLKV